MPQQYLNALVVLGTAAIAAWRESLRYGGEGGCTLAVEALARELEYQLNLSGSTCPAPAPLTCPTPAPLTCPTEAVEAVKDKVEELAARGPQDNSGIASLAQVVGGVVGHAVVAWLGRRHGARPVRGGGLPQAGRDRVRGGGVLA